MSAGIISQSDQCYHYTHTHIYIGWDVGIWTGLGWPGFRDRWRTLVSAVMSLRVP